MVYLLKMEGRSAVYYKVGFATDTDKRFKPYGTHNPIVECVEMVATYQKTKHSLETAIHAELKKQGYEFARAAINDIQTEWFSMSYEQAAEFDKKGLLNFKACQTRKVIRYKKVGA